MECVYFYVGSFFCHFKLTAKNKNSMFFTFKSCKFKIYMECENFMDIILI